MAQQAQANQPSQPKPTKAPKATPMPDSELGRIYIQRYGKYTIFARGQWYRYADGVWSPIPDFEIKVEVWKLLEMHEGHPWFLKPNEGMRKSVMAYAQAHLAVSEEKLDSHPHLINLKNGIYNLDADSLMPHDSALYLTSQLPFDFDPAAICPIWNLYIQSTFTDRAGQITDQELIYFLQEAIGYSLTTDISHQVMFWCIGEGENGKGVLFHVLMTLGGPAATYVDLNTLRKEKYQLATLLGKRIAMCSEASSHDNIVEDGTIKSLVAGDPTPVRQIHREGFILYPQAKFWWSMNRLPTITDTSHGFWRRMRPIPFNRVFDDTTRIIDMKERLNQELAGIFNWCLIGLRRLRANRKFSCCKQVERMKERLQTESNTIRLFIEDEAELTWMNCDGVNPDTLQTPSSEVYNRYKEWTKSNGYKPMSDRSFKTEMEALKFWYSRDASGKIRVYKRIKLYPISIFRPSP